MNYWYPVIRSDKLKNKPFSTSLLDTPIVVARLNGKLAAFIDRCPHRNAPLSQGKIINNNLRCPYHGWEFNSQGECMKIPGLCKNFNPKSKSLQTLKICDKYNFIWVSFANDPVDIYKPPLLNNNDYHSCIDSLSLRGSIANIAENFLDATHTHFIHDGLIRKEKQPRQPVTAYVRRHTNSVEIQYNEGKQNSLISNLLEPERSHSIAKFILPSVIELSFHSKKGIELIITAYITPTYADYCEINAIVSFRKGLIPSSLKQWIIRKLFKAVLKQDSKILELQRQNIQKFGKEEFVSTEIDIIRPHIDSLLKGHTKELNYQIQVEL